MPPEKPQISEETMAKWQRVVILIAELADVPATLIMRTIAPNHAVAVSSNGKDKPLHTGPEIHLE